MSNAVATAAQITTHDEFVAFYVANISPFAIEEIGEDTVASAQAGSYYDAEFVASRNHHIARLEALSDTALLFEYEQNEAAHRRAIELDDPSEYDVDDHESHYAEQWLIKSLLEHRAVQARYCSPQPLTHSPFAGLVAA